MPDVTQSPLAPRGGVDNPAPSAHYPTTFTYRTTEKEPGNSGFPDPLTGVEPFDSGWGPSHPVGPRALDS